jgi:hypothetical protein
MKNVLIIGFGNQGKKRFKIIKKLNYNLLVYDPKIKKYSNKNVLGLKYEFIFLCCSDLFKDYYLEKISIKNYSKLLIEKPLVLNKNNFLKIKNLCRKKKIYVSYNHIYDEGVAAFISKLKQKNIYYLDFKYMNGTAINVKLNKWRDKGTGVIYDLLPHLIHIVLKIGLKVNPKKFNLNIKKNFENKSPDFASIQLSQKKFIAKFDTSYISWKNTFVLNAYTKYFSIHLNGLKKWGSSLIIIYKRKFPSGIPNKKEIFFTGKDLSFDKETKLFLNNKIATSFKEIDVISKSLAISKL